MPGLDQVWLTGGQLTLDEGRSVINLQHDMEHEGGERDNQGSNSLDKSAAVLQYD